MCPICREPLDFTPSQRYPRALCSRCAATATDPAGRPVTFFNVDLSGGLIVHYPDDNTQSEAAFFDCEVQGIRCRAVEHRFGGIVLQPID